MRIQIFVVKTEKPNAQVLEQLRKSLVKMFKGLTIIPKATGYWVDEKGKEDKDIVEIWEIYTEGQDYYQGCYHPEFNPEFTEIMLQIKKVTKQSVQAFGVNNDMKTIPFPDMGETEKETLRVLIGKTLRKAEEIMGKDFDKDLFEEEVKK